ncbi:MAG: DUF4169 family protein [Paracoccaceae bacterium]|nr:DUF4169 family protein [Paracoccaceae bacterium]
MAEIINFNRAHKARERAKARAEANENAVKFGRRKADKELERALAEKALRDLDGHERE